jgi:hypothetical protein
MRMISNDGSLSDWAKKIEAEILAYSGEWFWPRDANHQIFEQAKMIFMNRNLNYFHVGNMVAAVCEGDEYNPNLAMTRKFCGYSRTLTGDTGPYGRMCTWNLQADKALLPHVDAYKYHFNIIRNIFIVSDHNSNDITININDHDVEFKQGTLFQFSPATERHAFVNTSNVPFYFLGYDFWIPEKLQNLMKDTESIANLMSDHDRLTKIERPKLTNCKYISVH